MRIKLLYLAMLGILLRLLTLNINSVFFQVVPGVVIVFVAVVSMRNNGWKSPFLTTPSRLRSVCVWLFILCASSVPVAMLNGFSGFAAAADLARFGLFCALVAIGFDLGPLNSPLLFRLVSFGLTVCNVGGIASVLGALPSQLIDGIVRPVGFVGAPQTMAHIALFSVIFFCFRFYVLYFRDRWKRGWRVALFQLLLGVVMVVLSATLKVALMMPVAILLLSLLLFRQKSVAVVVSVIVIAVAGIFVIFFGSGLTERLDLISASEVNLQITPGQKSEDSLEFRIIHWKLLLDSWRDGYMILGVGLGNAPELKGFGWFLGHNLDPHNDVLKVLLELGIIGAMFVSLLWFRLVQALLRAAQSDPLSAFCFCTIVTFTVVALAGKVFFTAFNLYFFSLLLGFSFGNKMIYNEKGGEDRA